VCELILFPLNGDASRNLPQRRCQEEREEPGPNLGCKLMVELLNTSLRAVR
jgi:hypothetical protein